jgi:ATP-dependent Clp protease ATP-binding subunit ClpB
MNIEKFTLKAQEALQEAKSVAERKNHQQIEVEHLLSALLEQKEGIVLPILQKLGANSDLYPSWRMS